MLVARYCLLKLLIASALFPPLFAAENVMILGVPDYDWHAGCFGTASGNLMAYWDRNGCPNFYTGPTTGGVAPLVSFGANVGIRSLWASQAGLDGRPANKPGHIDDYWDFYEGTLVDPYLRAGRPEHAPDCLGDFMGTSQNKWSDLDGECSGNIDAFGFNFWDKQGNRRLNFVPPNLNGKEVRDLQSGIRAWAKSRGTEADVFSQLADFNSEIPAGSGFTFEDLKREIDRGYPVMLFLQNSAEKSRSVGQFPNIMPRANPRVHAMVAYGYIVYDDGLQVVLYRDSWAGGDNRVAYWGPQHFEAELSLRGVIGFHPHPKISSIIRAENGLKIQWEGPNSLLWDNVAGASFPAHSYVLEKSPSLANPNFTSVTEPLNAFEHTVPNSGLEAYYRVRLLTRDQIPQ